MHTQHDHASHGHNTHGKPASGAVDPVCGMSVDAAKARAGGNIAEHLGKTYYFCGRGCRLEFIDAPEHFLDPSYRPSM